MVKSTKDSSSLHWSTCFLLHLSFNFSYLYLSIPEICATLRLPTPPMETPDPPSDTPGASKQVVLTPHDIPRSLVFIDVFIQFPGKSPRRFSSPKFSSKQISNVPSQANSRSPNTVAESPFAAETEYCASKVEVFKTCDFVAWIGVILVFCLAFSQGLLGQWLNFKLLGMTYLVGNIKFKLFFSESTG